jgi:predicted DNA-binding ribbon-helix-helix protein
MEKHAVKKRSVVVDGRRTSVSLEDRFWDSLRTIAEAEGKTIGVFVSEIHARGDAVNLSSAIRISILEYVQQKGFDQWRNAMRQTGAVSYSPN